ncbi:hypothetical protein E2562_022948 [Oryza meyeriana var. granulata]|uniref:FLZ-type domain-containing protein n=1 Tax=Oryza meyeriana var. granulata TaxID=110450 RepID=A0A6G1D8Q2_9ORYZ|nr:hypothetical protein E2562_022948 [Oryza meyeriana var. granulata]
MARTTSSALPAALLGAAAVVAKSPPTPASRRYFLDHGAAVVGVHAVVVDDNPAPAAAAMDVVVRVAQPARPSARSIMEGTHRQSSDSYCTVPRCSSCTGNPYAIAEFLLSCNLCGVPLASRPSFIYNSEKAFCKAECRSRYLAEALRKAKEEKRRVSPELKKETAAREGGEECKEGSIFFICPLDNP